ncbi:MAG: UDP-N-acetylmuramyl-tripeptide synthetase, partial [Phycisphaeraceae bacterium]
MRIVSEGGERAGSVRICDLTEDSRTVLPGSMFFARRGLKSDGRRYIGEAIRAGASAVLTDPSVDPGALGRSRAVLLHSEDVARSMAVISERFFGNPSRALRVVGVTGTNGKTTIAHFIHRMLNLCGVRCGMMGTVTIDDGFSVSEATLTTPTATELSHAMSKMVEAGCAGAVLEVSSHALDQQRVAGLDFDIGIFTNLSGDHLDYHGTMERYADAKATLFEMLAPDRLAIVNADDPASERMVRDCRARVVRCSLERDADCRGVVRRADRDGMAVTLHGGWGTIDAEVSLIGEHNLRNLLQAVCAVHALGVP